MSPSNYQIPKLPNYQILTSALLLVLFSAVLFLLQSGLRADAFFVGDPGIKLIAAKNAIARPDHPLDIPLPVIGHESLPYVEPFFEVHGDHVHAIATDLFPLASARAIQWFGLRGAYILPAVGCLALLIGCAWLLYFYLPVNNWAYFWGFFAMAVILVVLGVIAGLIAARVLKRGAPPVPTMAIEEAQKIKQTVNAPGAGS